MDKQLIQKINREALSAAKAEVGDYSSDETQNDLMVYAAAFAAAALTYYVLMNQYTPDIVMTTVNGVKKVDTTRVMVASAVVGVIGVVGYNYFYKSD